MYINIYLLEMGNNVSTNPIEKPSPLLTFTNKQELESLLEQGVHVDVCYDGKTALVYAALKDDLTRVRLLLLYNANPNPLINVGEKSVEWSTTDPHLSVEMQTLLEIYGFPSNIISEEDKNKMMFNIEECLKTVPESMHYPGGYASFMREDESLAVQDILTKARMYDHISRNLDYNHLALWMVKNGFVFVNE
jgi:ankyrin repeat protein